MNGHGVTIAGSHRLAQPDKEFCLVARVVEAPAIILDAVDREQAVEIQLERVHVPYREESNRRRAGYRLLIDKDFVPQRVMLHVVRLEAFRQGPARIRRRLAARNVRCIHCAGAKYQHACDHGRVLHACSSRISRIYLVEDVTAARRRPNKKGGQSPPFRCTASRQNCSLTSTYQ